MRRILLYVLLATLLACAWLPEARAQASRPAALATSNADASMAKRLYPMFQQVLLLRQALTDGSSGVASALIGPKASRIMSAIDAGPMQGFNAAAVWSYLFSTSVFAIGGGEDRPVAAFYHPYADVFAITEWELTSEGWRMADFELLPGDWLRSGGKGAVDLKPLWRRGKQAASDALVLEVRESIRAFEALFPPKVASLTWRQGLNLDQPEVCASLAQAPAALLLMECLQRLGELNAPQQGEYPGLAILRPRSEAFITLVAGAMWEDIFKVCPDIGPQTRKALSIFPAEAWAGVTPVFVDLQDAGGLVVYQRPQVPDGVLVLVLAGKEKRFAAKRIDFVYYPGSLQGKGIGGAK